MSFNASWMGIRAGAKAEVLRRLDLFETGEIDFGTSRGLFCAEWPSGWLVFYGPTDLVTPDLLARAVDRRRSDWLHCLGRLHVQRGFGLSRREVRMGGVP